MKSIKAYALNLVASSLASAVTAVEHEKVECDIAQKLTSSIRNVDGGFLATIKDGSFTISRFKATPQELPEMVILTVRSLLKSLPAQQRKRVADILRKDLEEFDPVSEESADVVEEEPAVENV